MESIKKLTILHSNDLHGDFLAEENGLLMTGGTDFHGRYTDPLRPLGSCGAPADTVQKLKEFKQARSK